MARNGSSGNVRFSPRDFEVVTDVPKSISGFPSRVLFQRDRTGVKVSLQTAHGTWICEVMTPRQARALARWLKK